MRLLPVSALALLASLAPDAPGQVYVPPQQRRGLMSSLALGFATEGDTFLRVSPPGNQQTPPGTYDPTLYPNAPDFSAASTYAGFPAIEFDAISTGNDFIGEIQSNGAANLGIPFPRWQAVTATFDASAQLPGSLLSTGSQGTVISHYLEGSSNFPTELEDTTHVEQSPRQLGYAPSAPPTFSGHDFALGVLATNSGPGVTMLPSSIVFLTDLDHLYFSVPQSYVDSLTQAQKDSFATLPPGQGGGPVTISAASVYRRSWTGTTWSAPVEWISAATLSLDPLTDDLDALSYDAVNDCAIYSTTIVMGRSQILAYDPATPGGGGSISGVAYKDTENNRLTIKLGSRDEEDDVKSLCTVDPGWEPGLVKYDGMIGIPVATGDGRTTSGISVQATRSGLDGQSRNLDVTFTMEATGVGSEFDPILPVVLFSLEDLNGSSLYDQVELYDGLQGSATWSWTAAAPPKGFVLRVRATVFDLGIPTWAVPIAQSCTVEIQI